MSRTVRGACPHDCPDRCGWEVTVDGTGVAVSLRGSSTHPLTAGRLCGKLAGYLDDRVYHPDRLTRALRRVGRKGQGRFIEIGLDQALDEIADRLRETADTDGPAAIVPFSYEGTQGLLQSKSMSERFFARLGATEVLHTICGATAGAGVSAVNGSTNGVLPEDARHAQLVLVWGANPVVTNQHLWPAVLAARANGGRIVVIDPVRTRTAAAADWHVQPRPGTDAVLALGIAHVIVGDGHTDRDWLGAHATGLDELVVCLERFTPEHVAGIVGIPAAEVVDLARAYAGARPALIRLMIGMEHHPGGAAAYTAIAGLPVLTGAWAHHGGGLSFHTAAHFMSALNMAGLKMPHLAAGPRRRINMVRLGHLLTDPDQDPPVRALFVHGSNPAVTVPSAGLVQAGLGREDLFTVVHDHVLTDTARFADIVIPATAQPEHLDLMWSWGHTDLMLNTPALTPPGDAISVTDLFRSLAARMGFTERCFGDTDADLITTAVDSDHPWLAGINEDELRATGWQRLALPVPYLPFADGFPTPDRKARLSPVARVAADLDGGPAPHGSPTRPLQLLTVKALHSMNSTYAETSRATRGGRFWLDIHPDDAARRGIGDNSVVRVHNDRGEIHLVARVGRRVRPGVVATEFGRGTTTSAGRPAGPANLLTDDTLTDAGGAAFHHTFVEVDLVG
ncbi:molybdopterin-dependent oxidoreductase [Solwaraspora sp. WMMD792]|uniref:molybdopterin-containing oxidoreductase family protein n=1 Tax=Solwaraspora sp. WMMD792 TaxID=3016099 RepID=UPI0024165DDD|nr:molybdopterin-dependent oxidoreductase [Solwaraspora sp. WMMD792]MDG4771688.1 molybdopterin-dependent oxidoreductase [Solwaraspora sp. WMMD792]